MDRFISGYAFALIIAFILLALGPQTQPLAAILMVFGLCHLGFLGAAMHGPRRGSLSQAQAFGGSLFAGGAATLMSIGMALAFMEYANFEPASMTAKAVVVLGLPSALIIGWVTAFYQVLTHRTRWNGVLTVFYTLSGLALGTIAFCGGLAIHMSATRSHEFLPGLGGIIGAASGFAVLAWLIVPLLATPFMPKTVDRSRSTVDGRRGS